MPTPIDIAFIADDAYTDPLGVTLVTLFDSARSPLRVHVVSTQTDPCARRTAALLRSLRADVRFIGRREVAAHLALRPGLSDHQRRHPHSVKLLLDEMLPELDRVLFLDSDLLVRADLEPLWASDLAGAILGAVEDGGFFGPPHEAFRAWHGGRYFNSGVMLIDLAAWRAADVGGRFADWHRFYERAGNAQPWVAYWEQSPLNMAVAGRWLRLSPRWNSWPGYAVRDGAEGEGRTAEEYSALLGVPVEELRLSWTDPAIYHFAGPNKPWRPEFQSHPSPFYAAWREQRVRARRLTDDALAREVSRPAARPAPLHGLHALSAPLHERIAARRRPVRLLQVGAHDGRTADPYTALLQSHLWHGVLIEPVTHLFATLRQTYAGCHGVTLRQVAASAADGRATFYAVAPADPPPVPWFSMISSFEIAPFVGHAQHVANLTGLVQEELIETRRLDTLIAEHDFVPDVVSISAEGHDAKVLSGLDLRRFRPLLVRLHIQHLPQTDRTAVSLRLKQAGYAAAHDATHLIAFAPELLTADELGAVAGDATGIVFV